LNSHEHRPPDKRDILAAAEVITPSLQGEAETQERVWRSELRRV
jgi:hypothetical protein